VRKTILKYTGDEFDRVVKVNLRGNFNVLQAAGRIMTTQKSGSIVLFSSITSVITPYAESDYSAANSFLDAFAPFANAAADPNT